MKIKHINTVQYSIGLIMVFMFMMVSGCDQGAADKNHVDQNDQIETINDQPTKKPKPPKVDIHTAVISGDTHAIQQHISAGTNINQKDPFGGSSPLISAALFNKPEIVRLLLDSGANIDFKNNDGSTALHVAAFFCRPEIVQLLLKNNADKTIKNNRGSTAYDTVAGPFIDVKPIYDMLGQALAPMGLTLDYDYLKVTRPQIALLLK